MKNWILRAAVAGLAAVLSGAVACGGSGGGCGGNSSTTDTNVPTIPSMTCGSGTHLEGSQCVPNTGTATTSAAPAAAPKRL